MFLFGSFDLTKFIESAQASSIAFCSAYDFSGLISHDCCFINNDSRSVYITFATFNDYSPGLYFSMFLSLAGITISQKSCFSHNLSCFLRELSVRNE